jgi:hypothetical protein
MSLAEQLEMVNGLPPKKQSADQMLKDSDTYEELRGKLDLANLQIAELRRALSGAKKIELEQGKALEKLENQTENPQRLK